MWFTMAFIASLLSFFSFYSLDIFIEWMISKRLQNIFFSTWLMWWNIETCCVIPLTYIIFAVHGQNFDCKNHLLVCVLQCECAGCNHSDFGGNWVHILCSCTFYTGNGNQHNDYSSNRKHSSSFHECAHSSHKLIELHQLNVALVDLVWNLHWISCRFSIHFANASQPFSVVSSFNAYQWAN